MRINPCHNSEIWHISLFWQLFVQLFGQPMNINARVWWSLSGSRLTTSALSEKSVERGKREEAGCFLCSDEKRPAYISLSQSGRLSACSCSDAIHSNNMFTRTLRVWSSARDLQQPCALRPHLEMNFTLSPICFPRNHI